MKIFAMFGTRKYAEDELELFDAWDEYTVDENPDGFQEAKSRWAQEPDLATFAIVTFEVSREAVMGALYPEPPAVTATLISSEGSGVV